MGKNIDLDGTLKPFIAGDGVINGSAQLEAKSTTKGFLPPRMNTSQRTAIAAPVDGLEVYDTDVESLFQYQNGSWVDLKNRSTHTGTQTASTISDFDTEVSNNVDVAANTVHRTSDGSDHTYIDQDVKSTASPTFTALQSIDYVDFDLSAVVSNQEGRVSWNSDDGTIEVGLPGGNVRLQVGQEGVIKVRNESGSKIANGKVVYPTGASGNKLTIDIADYCDADKIMLLGMTTEDIDHNSNGYVALWGIVRGTTLQPINTSSYPEGTKLYLDSSGNWTNVHPSDPTCAVIVVGIVQRQHASEGEISLQFNYFTIGNNFDGTLRQGIINKNTGTSAATGFTAVNDQGHWMTVGIGGSNNATFPDNSVYYGSGYNDNLYAVDGNKSHKWFNDPTDSHNNSSLSYLNMELDSAGNLTIYRGQIVSSIVTGTAPISVVSTTLVINLNSDLLDGQHGSYYLARSNHTGTQTASTISDFDTEVSNNVDVSANTTHRTSDGSDHTFIDQDVTSGSSPTFTGTNFSGIPASALPDADDDGVTKGVSTYENADFNVTAGVVSIEDSGIDHNSVSGKDGGTAGQYYHLTSAQHSKLTAGLDITTVNAATYTAQSADGVLLVSYTDTGSVTITIPSALIATDGYRVVIKDSGFNSSINNITIETEGAETIDEQVDFTINGDGDSVTIVTDQSNLFVI